MRRRIAITLIALTGWNTTRSQSLPDGLAYSNSSRADHIELLVDETWVNANGARQIHQQIFDAVYDIIDRADQFILLDFFLVNNFLYEDGPGMRPLSSELTEKLLAKRANDPNVQIIFITDPINSVYGSVPSPLFQALETAGVQVVRTDLNRLRDSNPVVSKPWRLLAQPFGTGPGITLPNPIGEGRVSVRSMLKLLNFKANHRKIIVTEKSLLVTSANPHSGSSAHWNMALRVDGAGQAMACEAESAILKFSGADAFQPDLPPVPPVILPPRESQADRARPHIELLTERAIKNRILELLNAAQPGARIDLILFYLSDSDILNSLTDAKKRDCDLRVILDPNRDAFGIVKNGIPNRQSADRLVKTGIPVRWADTHGEQCHVKTLYIEHPDGTATLVLGSANYTRRNLDNFNTECDLACTAGLEHTTMKRARETFDRWWSNPDGRTHTTDYKTYKDTSILKKIKARFMEETGMSSF